MTNFDQLLPVLLEQKGQFNKSIYYILYYALRFQLHHFDITAKKRPHPVMVWWPGRSRCTSADRGNSAVFVYLYFIHSTRSDSVSSKQGV